MNHRDNAEFISGIAQRDVAASGWADANPEKFDKVRKSADSPRNGKYSMLNVTMRTIEVRIFNSSLLVERIYKNIEFCHALVSWCKTAKANVLTPRNFVIFVIANRATYPELAQFITDRNL
jgi:hypothetical protein